MLRTVLVVDDDVTYLTLVEKLLTAEGFYVIKADDFVEGLALAKTYMPDLIILDVMMSRMDGYGFFKKLRKNPDTALIPVIISTFLAAMKDEFIGLGADSFISKPFKAEDFLAKVHRIFDGSRILRLPASILQRKKGWSLFGSKKKPSMKSVKKGDAVWEKKVVVSGEEKRVMDIMSAMLSEEACTVEVVNTAQGVIDKVIEWEPDIVLLEVLLGTHSSYEVINLLSQIPNLNLKVLVYSFFRDKDQEKNSIVHRLYRNKAVDFVGQEKGFSVDYLGAFHIETFALKIKKQIYALRGLKY